MKTTECDNQINQPESMTPLVVCFATGVLGVLGLVAVATAPWLLLA